MPQYRGKNSRVSTAKTREASRFRDLRRKDARSKIIDEKRLISYPKFEKHAISREFTKEKSVKLEIDKNKR